MGGSKRGRERPGPVPATGKVCSAAAHTCENSDRSRREWLGMRCECVRVCVAMTARSVRAAKHCVCECHCCRAGQRAQRQCAPCAARPPCRRAAAGASVVSESSEDSAIALARTLACGHMVRMRMMNRSTHSQRNGYSCTVPYAGYSRYGTPLVASHPLIPGGLFSI